MPAQHNVDVTDDHAGPVLITVPLHPACQVIVILPVRDEAETLPLTLDALHCQVDWCGRPLDPTSFEIILLANNCRDQTAALARAYAFRHPSLRLHVVERVLPPEQANIGTARRLLMDVACHRLLQAGRPNGVIASTDGDTVVSRTWIVANLKEIATGADAVGGRIKVAASELARLDPGTIRYHLLDTRYRLMLEELKSLLDPDPADPWQRHHQHFGASLAVTAEAYARAGGIPRVKTLEDVAFYQSLRRVDAHIRHSPYVTVVTSTRQSGRVALGLSTQLGEWTEMAQAGRPLLMDSPVCTERHICSRRRLRELWTATQTGMRPVERQYARLARPFGLTASWLISALHTSATFGQLYERVITAATTTDTEAPVAIGPALLEIQTRLSVLRVKAVPADSISRRLPPFEEVKPVPFFSPAMEMDQLFTGEERVMDLIAG